MAYGRQLQIALDRFDQSLARLHTLIKRGENKAAIHFMTEGQLKERFEELQNMVSVSGGGREIGSGGTAQTGTF